ncbi:MAG: hypothetical protein AB1758_14320 [Candidatus Eremiobacterota bacterium]
MRLRGLSLPEVLVACTLLAVMAVALAWFHRVGLNAARKSGGQTDAYRAVMIGLEHVKVSLRGARVVVPSSGTSPSLVLQTCKVQNGTLEVDPAGIPVWSGAVALECTTDGRLVRFPERRVLARLGKGLASFERLGPNLLGVRILADLRDPNVPGGGSRYEVRTRFYLSNI